MQRIWTASQRFYSGERIDGRRFEDPQATWLVDVELAAALGISLQKSLRWLCLPPPQLVALPSLGLWVPGLRGRIVRRTARTGRSDDAKTRKAGRKSWRQKKKLNFLLKVYLYDTYSGSRIYRRSNKRASITQPS